MKFVISSELTDLNSYINAERTNRYAGAKIKREETEFVYWSAIESGISLRTKPVKVICTWYSKNRRKDPDNIAFSKKFILDGLVKAGVLEDDTQKWIKGFEDHFHIDKEDPRVEVDLQY